MGERRPLIEGLKTSPPTPEVDPKKEQEFVYGSKKQPHEMPPQQPASAVQNVSRVPMSTRIRSDYAAALKRASLERQLQGTEPNTLQDILEQAIEPWLKTNGYMD